MSNMSVLSKRGQFSLHIENMMMAWNTRYLQNSYHATTNPDGIVNMGMAENYLCEDILQEKLNGNGGIKFGPDVQYYFEFRGLGSFRQALAKFLTDRFEANSPVDPEHLTVTTGVGGALDLLAHLLTDPGDAVLCPSPVYSVFEQDIQIRGHIKLLSVDLQPAEGDGEEAGGYCISRKALERGLALAKAQGVNLKALLLVNPDNPTGRIFPRQSLLTAMQFCHEHDLHIIVDEIYGLTVWGEDAHFTSALSIHPLPDPQRTHVLWGFSKDFGLSGLRCGVVHSCNADLNHSLAKLAYFCAVPAIVQTMLQGVITDTEWLDNVYFPTNLQRVRGAYKHVVEWLQARGVPTCPDTKAAHFVWADLSQYLPSRTKEQELELFEQLMSGGVYVVAGTALLCTEPGWFRITFTIDPSRLDLGLDRMDAVLKTIKRK